jgi:hypothetical protein
MRSSAKAAISKREKSRPAIAAAFGVFKRSVVRVSFAMTMGLFELGIAKASERPFTGLSIPAICKRNSSRDERSVALYRKVSSNPRVQVADALGWPPKAGEEDKDRLFWFRPPRHRIIHISSIASALIGVGKSGFRNRKSGFVQQFSVRTLGQSTCDDFWVQVSAARAPPGSWLAKGAACRRGSRSAVAHRRDMRRKRRGRA